MKKHLKWITRLCCLSLLLCLTVVSLAACGSSTSNADDASGTLGTITWAYTKDSKTLTLTGAGAMENITVNDDSDAPWAEARLSAEKIVVNEGITSIGSYAFWGMNNVTDISLPASLTAIGDFAFAYCGKVTQVNIPTAVTAIGKSAFEGCIGLTSLYLPESVTSIGDYAFAYCSAIQSAIITGDPGDGVAFIGAYAFHNCRSLSNLVIRDGVEESQIGENAFKDAAKDFASAEKTTNPSADSQITINYVKDDAAWGEPTVTVLGYGKTQTFTPPTLEGYTPDPLSITATGNGADQTFTVIYKQNEAAPEETPADTTPAETEAAEESGGVKPSTIIAIVIMGVVLVAIAVGAFFLIRSDKKDAKKNTKNQAKKK